MQYLGKDMFVRKSRRKYNELRPVKFTRNFTKYAEGSVLVEFGDTKVIVTAMIEDKVPRFLIDSGQGWLTAEYSILPGATQSRVNRDRGMLISGRTQEIQRLIGRSLRASIDLKQIGERTITIDADVIQADGGTRTASISGGFIAVYDALSKLCEKKQIDCIPVIEQIAAVSVALVDGEILLDPDYFEDSNAIADANIIMGASGKIIEFQCTGEKSSFDKKDLYKIIDTAEEGISQIVTLQKEIIGL